MPTYDVLVSDKFIAEWLDATAEGFRIVGPTDGPAEHRTKRFRVEDDNAPAWTEGKLISPAFRVEYEFNEAGYPTGNVSRVAVTDWTEVTA